jgi:methyl-accepting chemotaxis protein
MNWSPVRRAALYATLIVAAAMTAACLSQKDPAQKALNDATGAVNQALTPDADKYAPNGVTALQGKLAALKTTFDGKNYATVITSAPDVMASARDLTQVVETNKEAESKKLAAQWTEATAPVRNLLETVHARVDELGKAKHPPKHVDLPTARTDLTAADDLWAKAKSSYGSGKIDEALASVKELKEKADAAAAAINLQVPQ